MSPRQRMLAIRLTEKLAKNPEYARTIGVEISDKKTEKETKKIPSQSRQTITDRNTI